jgi:hypothetical protein
LPKLLRKAVVHVQVLPLLTLLPNFSAILPPQAPALSLIKPFGIVSNGLALKSEQQKTKKEPSGA